MVKSASTRAALLPYPIIAAAVRGEPDAVNTVIRHYSAKIATPAPFARDLSTTFTH